MATTLEDELGDIIAKARFGLGLTVSDVARDINISVDEVAEIEAYRRSVSQAEARALADTLKLNADALWKIAQHKYKPSVPEYPFGIHVVPFVFSPMASNSYLLRLESSGDTFLIDVGGDPAPIMDTLHENSWELTAVLITHGHSDHVFGVDQIKKLTSAPIYAHSREWSGDGLIAIEDVIKDGEADADHASHRQHSMTIASTQIDVLYSPGHTPNGYTFVVDGLAFVGDTLFAGSLGRALEGPRFYPQLIQSAHRILQLSPDTILLPGHGPSTTVSEERRNNPFVASLF